MNQNHLFENIDLAVTICDENLKIVYMNKKSIDNFQDEGGEKLIGTNLLNCHSESSKEMILKIKNELFVNCYTIEKNGIKSMIRQSPIVENNEFKGIIEISFQLSDENPHFVRQDKDIIE